MTNLDKVREFHTTFGHPVSDHATANTLEMRRFRLRLIIDEVCELAEAMGLNLSVIPQEGVHNIFINEHRPSYEPDLLEMADAIGDIKYVCEGANLVFGIPGDAVFDAIQKSNMSKLGEDGKPLVREDGKILKGPNYKPPTDDIRQILEAAR